MTFAMLMKEHSQKQIHTVCASNDILNEVSHARRRTSQKHSVRQSREKEGEIQRNISPL